MSAEVTEQSILEALHKVPQEKWSLVLEILHNLEPKPAPPSGEAEPTSWTPAQFRALPRAEQDAILEAAAIEAAKFYPIGLDDDYSDLYGNDTDTPPR
jgi:hypothetical protein